MAEVVITLVHGRHEHLLRQWRMLRTVAPEVPYVVIAMGDNAIAGLLRLDPHAHVVEIPVTPDGLPLAAARNLGVRTARQLGGEPELLVILDVDCLPGPGLITRYAEAGRRAPEDLLCGPVTYLPQGLLPETPEALAAATAPHPARPAPEAGDLERDGVHDLFWSLSFALTPATWDRIGGFCEEFTGYGGEDTDFAWRAKAAGVGLAWVGGAHAYHQWHPVSTPPIEHLDDIVRNAQIVHRRWGRWPMRGWLDAFEASGLITWRMDASGTPRPTRVTSGPDDAPSVHP